MLLTVLAHTHDGVGRIATNHEDCGAATAFDQLPRRVTLHRLEGARNTPLPMQRAQGDTEHRHIHLRTVLRAEACGQHLDEAHTGSTVYGFADSRTRDKGSHAVVDQTGHHVARVVRRLRAHRAGCRGYLHDTDRRGNTPGPAEPKVPSQDWSDRLDSAGPSALFTDPQGDQHW